MEAAVDGVPDGRMLALQVKSGASYFAERTDTHVVYRGSAAHLDYWLGHSLPVLIVLHDPSSGTAYWEVITGDTTRSTGRGWRVDIPINQTLTAPCAETLRALADGDSYVQYLNALRADRTWMSLLRDGGRLFLEVDEWINKTSGRGTLRLVGSPAGIDDVVRRERTWFFGLADYAEVLPRVFPWADLSVDEDLYDMHEEDAWHTETGAYDKETDSYLLHTEGFTDWRDRRPALRPYEQGIEGEVDRWRLQLTLNELGAAFLTVDEAAAAGW